ncbi:MAG: HD domain-containing protein [Planctomycetota bacterium]
MFLSEAVRDPVHGLVRLEREDLAIIDSRPFQRLRFISQLGLTDRVYPGARHSRFEHALGTVEVTTRLLEEMRARLGLDGLLTPLGVVASESNFQHLLRISRYVALLHDLGHSPFSHVTEKLLPEGGHEEMTRSLLDHPEISKPLVQCGEEVYSAVCSILNTDHADLPADYRFIHSLVCGGFGTDRMDYLLRDSHCLGVQYGSFDLPRILHTLIPVETDDGVHLGIERGGVLAAEGMQWARFSMFTQVYFHRTRRILDLHLINFLRDVIPGGRYPDDPEGFLGWDDPRVFVLLREAERDPEHVGHMDARRILAREHHRSVGDLVEGQDIVEVAERLAFRLKEIRLVDASLDPIADVVTPPPDLTAGTYLPVQDENGEVRRLGQISALVGRLRVRPFGRIYCARTEAVSDPVV